jgi:hypothetical protein
MLAIVHEPLLTTDLSTIMNINAILRGVLIEKPYRQSAIQAGSTTPLRHCF